MSEVIVTVHRSATLPCQNVAISGHTAEVKRAHRFIRLLGVKRVGLGAQTAGSRGVLLEVAAESGRQE